MGAFVSSSGFGEISEMSFICIVVEKKIVLGWKKIVLGWHLIK